MIIVTYYVNPGLNPQTNADHHREVGDTINVNAVGVLTIEDRRGVVRKAYAPGKWVEAVKQS